MITVIATLTLKPGAGPEFEADFRTWAKEVKAKEPGTLEYTLSRSRENPGVYYALEVYADDAAFAAHVQNLQARQGGPDVFAQPPLIQILDKVV